MTAYFDKENGIGYSFARTHIASCDFSSESYDYVEENDAELKTFSIAHDKEFRVPFIKRAFEVADGDLKMFVSPWSPPGWMKDSQKKLTGGSLLDEYRQSWANHFVKFIDAYEAEGRITSYNVCYTKLLRTMACHFLRATGGTVTRWLDTSSPGTQTTGPPPGDEACGVLRSAI